MMLRSILVLRKLWYTVNGRDPVGGFECATLNASSKLSRSNLLAHDLTNPHKQVVRPDAPYSKYVSHGGIHDIRKPCKLGDGATNGIRQEIERVHALYSVATLYEASKLHLY
jgi:hypothetical protein